MGVSSDTYYSTCKVLTPVKGGLSVQREKCHQKGWVWFKALTTRVILPEVDSVLLHSIHNLPGTSPGNQTKLTSSCFMCSADKVRLPSHAQIILPGTR